MNIIVKVIGTLGGLLISVVATQASAQATPDQLSTAIYKTDVAAVRKLLGAGVSPKSVDSNGFAPLVSAVMVSSQPAKEGDALQIAAALLDAGADIEQQGPVGNTPLSAACGQTRSARVVEFLLDHGAKVNSRGYAGTTALYQAVRRGHDAIAEVLLKRGADAKAANSEGQTALHYAAMNGMESTASFLLERGADINARDVDGKTPLAWALGNTPASFIGRGRPMPKMVDLLRRSGGAE